MLLVQNPEENNADEVTTFTSLAAKYSFQKAVLFGSIFTEQGSWWLFALLQACFQ